MTRPTRHRLETYSGLTPFLLWVQGIIGIGVVQWDATLAAAYAVSYLLVELDDEECVLATYRYPDRTKALAQTIRR